VTFLTSFFLFVSGVIFRQCRMDFRPALPGAVDVWQERTIAPFHVLFAGMFAGPAGDTGFPCLPVMGKTCFAASYVYLCPGFERS